MWRSVLAWFSRHLPMRVIFDRDGAKPYLSRFYIFGGPRDLENNTNWRQRPFNVFLHRFHMSDDADALHNHPWSWSFSLILSGGYEEERRVPTHCSCPDANPEWAAGSGFHANDRVWSPGCAKHGLARRPFDVVRRRLRPGMVNVIRGDDYHRVDLTGEDCWSLFFAGPKTGESWNFWDRTTGVTKAWWQFIEERRREAHGP